MQLVQWVVVEVVEWVDWGWPEVEVGLVEEVDTPTPGVGVGTSGPCLRLRCPGDQ